MVFNVYNDDKRDFIASDEQLAANNWSDSEYHAVAASSIEASSWLAAKAQFLGDDEPALDDDLSLLDYWIEQHGTDRGFFEQLREAHE